MRHFVAEELFHLVLIINISAYKMLCQAVGEGVILVDVVEEEQ